MQQRPEMAFWVSFTLLGDHAPRHLKLPPLTVLQLHKEGAAGKVELPLQISGTHVPQKLEPLAVHALSTCRESDAPCPPGRTGPFQPSLRGEPSPSRAPRGKVVSPPWSRTSSPPGEARLVPAPSSALRLQNNFVQANEDLHNGAIVLGPLGMGSVIAAGYIQVQDPAGLLRVVVLLAQLGVVGFSERLEDAAQPSHDRGPRVLVGLLVGQRDVLDQVKPQL